MTKKKSFSDLVLESVLYVIGYGLVLIVLDVIFDSLYLDNNLYSLWAFITAFVLYLLNKIVKPLILHLALPITAVTAGAFYFVVNALIFKLCDFILVEHFNLTNLFITFLLSIIVALMRLLIETMVIEPLLKYKNRKRAKK